MQQTVCLQKAEKQHRLNISERNKRQNEAQNVPVMSLEILKGGKDVPTIRDEGEHQ